MTLLVSDDVLQMSSPHPSSRGGDRCGHRLHRADAKKEGKLQFDGVILPQWCFGAHAVRANEAHVIREYQKGPPSEMGEDTVWSWSCLDV